MTTRMFGEYGFLRKRNPAYLTPTEGKQARNTLIGFVDVDTVEGQLDYDKRTAHTLGCWHLILCKYRADGQHTFKQYTGSTSKHFWTCLRNQTLNTNIKYLNIIGSDMAKTLPLLDVYQQTEDMTVGFVSEGVHPAVTLKNDVCEYAFVDAFRVWGMHNWELAKQLGLAQPVSAAERTQLVVDAHSHWRECVLKHNLGFRVLCSIGGQALSSYKRWMPARTLAIHCDVEALSLERAACEGGYMMALQTGYMGDGFLLDFNAAYVAEMRNPMPARRITSGDNIDLTELDRLLNEGHTIVAEVDLCGHVPHLLVHCRRHCATEPETSQYSYEHDDPSDAVASVEIDVETGAIDTNFRSPVYGGQNALDTYRCRVGHCAVLTTPEIAAMRPYVTAVRRFVSFATEYPFDAWCDHIWGARQAETGDPFTSAMLKRLGAALHGRFKYTPMTWVLDDDLNTWGLDASHWHALCGVNCEQEGTHRHRFRQIMGRTERQDVFGEGSDTMPAIYAHTTAYARMRLLELIETVGWGDVWYADTDGIIVSPEGANKIPHHWLGDGLGELSVEYLTDVRISGVKRYTHGAGAKLSSYPADGFLDGTFWVFDEWQGWFPYNAETDGVAYSWQRKIPYPAKLLPSC